MVSRHGSPLPANNSGVSATLLLLVLLIALLSLLALGLQVKSSRRERNNRVPDLILLFLFSTVSCRDGERHI